MCTRPQGKHLARWQHCQAKIEKKSTNVCKVAFTRLGMPFSGAKSSWCAEGAPWFAGWSRGGPATGSLDSSIAVWQKGSGIKRPGAKGVLEIGILCPSSTIDSSFAEVTTSRADRIPSAIGGSNLDPSFLMCAGTRSTVMRSVGNAAVLQRSLRPVHAFPDDIVR